jgi:mannose-6-phosphate isomerase-like protein (cupin superfamily)
MPISQAEPETLSEQITFAREGSTTFSNQLRHFKGGPLFAKKFEQGEPLQCAGNNYRMLLPRDLTDCCEVVLEEVAPGKSTPPNQHETFLQIYVVLEGHAELFIGDEAREVRGPLVALIPRRADHYIVNKSGKTPLRYLYISVWPEGIPAAERDGGWKKVYERMIQEYADRGYPNKADP